MSAAPAPRRVTLGSGSTVAVVGGGIAGLSAAWALLDAAPGMRVVVYEADGRLGGKLRSQDIGGRAVDVGPDAFVARRPEALELCQALGLGDELVAPASRAAYVWARGRLRRLPAGLALGVPTRLGPLARSGILSPAGVVRAALDLVGVGAASGAAGADRAVAAITRPRLGHQVTARLVDPLVGGIHAGDTRRMSAAAVYPPLLDAAVPGSVMRHLRRAAPSPPGPDTPVFLRVRGGMTRLVDALGAALSGRGAVLRTAAEVDRLDLTPDAGHHGHDGTRWVVHAGGEAEAAEAVVVATPATAAARLLGPVDDALGAELAAVPQATVTIVTMRVPTAGVGRPLDGTGFLVPAESGMLVTACTWLSAKWPEMEVPGEVLLRASVGRFGDDRHLSMTDDLIAERVVAELGPLMELRATPAETVVTRWPDAFPQYEVGHLARVAEIERRVAALPNLAVAGAALRGVGIPACIDSGRRAASALVGGGVVVGRT